MVDTVSRVVTGVNGEAHCDPRDVMNELPQEVLARVLLSYADVDGLWTLSAVSKKWEAAVACAK